jgi:hypothetical protein
MTTHLVAGDEAMISLVRTEVSRSGKIHACRQEQWKFCVEGSGLRSPGDAQLEVSGDDF